jgi:glutamate-1-semialdehyde 2,1-aminomutase
MVRDTLIANYNEIESVETLFEHNQGEIATIVVEPVPGNIGVVLPQNDFLLKLRDVAHKNGAVLIFDEVMSGFRQNYGGAQKFYGVSPDITCLGKIIGGGLPVGAYGARAEIMDMVAPLGPMYQAGTLSGNPLAMAAGIAMLECLRSGEVYKELNANTEKLAEGIRSLAAKHGIPVQVATFGSMITPFFTDKPVTDYTSAVQSDTKRFGFFFWKMIENGMFLPPSQFEAWFVSTQHKDKEIEETLTAVDKAFAAIV